MSCRTSILDGVDIAVLQSRLAALQQAYLDLSSGGKLEVVSYAQGDGNKSVTYSRTNIGALTQAIITVQTQIDSLNGVKKNRRAAIRPFF